MSAESGDSASGSALASTLWEIPVLADSFNYAKNTKYGSIAVNATGAALDTVNKITSPVQERLRPQINQVDQFAANTVKSIGDRVPVIRSPTNDIIEKVKTPLATVTTPVYTIAAGVSGELEQRVAVPAKNLAQSVDRSMQPVVDKYATLVESYLPKGDESSEEADEVSEFQQTQRALKTTVKVQRRLSQQLRERLTSTQNSTQEQLRQLHEHSALLRNVTESLNELNLKLLSMVLYAKQNAVTFRDTMQSPELAVSIHDRLHSLVGAVLGELDKEKDLPKAVKERVIELSHNLLTTTDTIATYVKANAVHFPEHIKQHLAPLISFFNDRYADLMEEINKKDTALEKAKNIAQVTADHVLPILERSLSEIQKTLSYGSPATTNVDIRPTNAVDVSG